ncbi:hypothetical protein DFH09DRAFT_201514 [Mycena vulgaris]|nr:hypothetical protein DFH09DRAFT_201514 [Mycena vulgaris]
MHATRHCTPTTSRHAVTRRFPEAHHFVLRLACDPILPPLLHALFTSAAALPRIAPPLTRPRSPRRRTHPRAERLLLLPLAHLPVLARIVLQHLVDVEQPQRVERGEHGELEEGVVGPREYWDERRRGGGTKGWVYAQDGQSLFATALARVQVDTHASTDPRARPSHTPRTRASSRGSLTRLPRRLACTPWRW